MLVLMLLTVFIIMIFVVQGIAFITLCERHLLGGSHQRIGPNKVSLAGLIQAIFDGVKLMKKEQLVPKFSANTFFVFIPGVLFLVMFLDWFVLPYFFDYITFEYSIMFFLCLMGFGVYSFLMSGIMSKSKYSILGALRASSQSVSYEIAFSLYVLSVIVCFSTFMFKDSFNFGFMVLVLPFFFMVLAELNRAPFDFSEGESELVSGYNVEYGSVSFALLFMGEYGLLLFFSTLVSVLFFGFSLLFIYLLFCSIIFVRSSFPRFRYDMMMGMFWFCLLPVSLFFLLYFIIMLF